MPCYDHRDSPEYIHKHEIKPLQERNTELARMLCEACQYIEALEEEHGYSSHVGLSEELKEWWEAHKEWNEQREKTEELLKCPKCDNPGKPEHLCPYAEDVGDDSSHTCRCCDECRKACYDEI